VAGKTGTAQTGRSRSGREFPTHAWFVGFFPAARAGEPPVEPRYAVAVLCENTDLHGGWIANYVLHAFLRRVEGELLR
jgi:cell division protein FtsI/penicillin-binding protein 2